MHGNRALIPSTEGGGVNSHYVSLVPVLIGGNGYRLFVKMAFNNISSQMVRGRPSVNPSGGAPDISQCIPRELLPIKLDG